MAAIMLLNIFIFRSIIIIVVTSRFLLFPFLSHHHYRCWKAYFVNLDIILWINTFCSGVHCTLHSIHNLFCILCIIVHVLLLYTLYTIIWKCIFLFISSASFRIHFGRFFSLSISLQLFCGCSICWIMYLNHLTQNVQCTATYTNHSRNQADIH